MVKVSVKKCWNISVDVDRSKRLARGRAFAEKCARDFAEWREICAGCVYKVSEKFRVAEPLDRHTCSRYYE